VLTGLEPDSSYTYIVEVEGRRASPASFQDVPARRRNSFSIAFAACAGDKKTGVSNHAVFEAIAQRRPRAVRALGISTTGTSEGNLEPESRPEGTTAAGSSPGRSTTRSRSSASRPLPQHARCLHVGRPRFRRQQPDGSSATQGIAQPAYRLHVPHYPLVDGATSIQQAFDIGRVRVIVTDSRSQRDEPSMLGRAQLDWLFGELRKAGDDRVPLVIWVNSVPWISHDMHGWNAFATSVARSPARSRASGS